MSRTMLITVAAILVVGGLIFALNRPEPTPEERLEQAVRGTGESVRDATETVSDAVKETTDSIAGDLEKSASDAKESITKTLASMTEEVAASTAQTRDQLQAFLSEWKDSGIITENGIDFDRAIQAVDDSTLSEEGKARARNILSALRDAPGAFAEKLSRLESDLIK